MVKINDTTTFPLTAPASGDFVIGTDISDTGNSADGEVVNFTLQSIADLAKPILSPDLDLTYKTGTASRASSGTSTVVSLTTADLSNLADMTLALVTGWINVLPNNEAGCGGEISVTNDGTILSFDAFDDSNEEKRSFAYLIVLSSDTSVTISMTHSGSGTVSAAGQVLILGR